MCQGSFERTSGTQVPAIPGETRHVPIPTTVTATFGEATLSHCTDALYDVSIKGLRRKEIGCRRDATAIATTKRRASGLGGLEHRRLEPVSLEQLVELGAVALRQLRRLR